MLILTQLPWSPNDLQDLRTIVKISTKEGLCQSSENDSHLLLLLPHSPLKNSKIIGEKIFYFDMQTDSSEVVAVFCKRAFFS